MNYRLDGVCMFTDDFPVGGPRVRRGRHGRRPLHFMAKPSPELANAIFELPRTDRNRRADLLHITLLGLVDLADVPPEFVHAVAAIMEAFEANAFHVLFDRIHEHRCVTLRSSEALRGALAFQHKLVSFLSSRDFLFFGDPPKPHLTISYHPDGGGREDIDPISWRVEELLLIESLVGQEQHKVHGRWSLRS